VAWQHGAMIAAGLVLVAWGLPAAHRLRSPLDIPAALAVPAGVLLGLLGTLLLAVPGFFKG